MRRFGFILLMLLILAGCAARQSEVQDEDQALVLREVRKVRFQGNNQFSAGALRKAMASKQRPFFPPWKRGETYNRSTLEADRKRLQKYYFDRGFLNTQVSDPKVEENEEKNTVEITITIEEGPPTLVKTVRIVGHVPPELPPEDQIMSGLALQAGGRITKANFDRSQAQLTVMMQDVGYARARVVPRTEVDFDAHEAAIAFELQSGELTPFGDITITGQDLIKERAIRRQLRIEPGDIYSADQLTRTSDAIYGIGMFRSVTPLGTNLEAEDEPLDIDIKVQERKPRTIELQAGFSTVEGPRFRAAWTHRNFFRGGEQLTLEGRGSFISQEARATLSFPYFLAQRTSFTQTLSALNDHLLAEALGVIDPQPDFDLFSITSISRIDRELVDNLTASVGLDLSYNDFYNVNADAETEASTEDNLLVIQFGELTYNTSNDFLNPTRGFLLRGRLDHSTTGLLSDVNFAKFELEGRHYLPIWWKMIFATRLVLGTIQPYSTTNSDEIPRNVRFFAGGPGSVRGFRLNRLGPLDSDDDPVGGNSLIEGSTELRFPIAGQLWGALFVDFGNVYTKPFTYRLNDLRYAAGPGIRYITPIGPIRLDIGFVIDPRSNEDTARLEFSIGQAF
ncbi:outer membrane protein assembly factor BamA [Candidatus Entotheonella palauensis]|nr:outer membrane protein assembly factor BamA [Candidatus Entotheonella palauensis]